MNVANSNKSGKSEIKHGQNSEVQLKMLITQNQRKHSKIQVFANFGQKPNVRKEKAENLQKTSNLAERSPKKRSNRMFQALPRNRSVQWK